MKPKSWIITGTFFLISSSLWGAYVLSQRAFLRDFNAGVHAYLAGDYAEAETSLKKAVERHPRNDQAKQLLLKTFIERSFEQYHEKNYAAALATLDRASQAVPMDQDTQQTLAALRGQLAVPEDQRPVNMEKVLAGLYRRLPEKSQPNNLQTVMDQWLQRSQASQEAVLKRFWDNQEAWLLQLEKQKEQFKRIFYGGLILFGLGGLALIALLVGVLHTYFGRRGVFARLLDDHYKRLVAALPAGSQVLLGPPVSLHQVPEAQQMDIIEAEISSGLSAEESARRLQSLLEGENPWVRARAAKILYSIDPKTSLQELKRLVSDASSGSQVPGMWALTELATEESLDLIVPLAYSPSIEIQQGAIRSLLQLHSKENLQPEIKEKLNKILVGIRSRTGWIF
jgi:hypothetical protein